MIESWRDGVWRRSGRAKWPVWPGASGCVTPPSARRATSKPSSRWTPSGSTVPGWCGARRPAALTGASVPSSTSATTPSPPPPTSRLLRTIPSNADETGFVEGVGQRLQDRRGVGRRQVDDPEIEAGIGVRGGLVGHRRYVPAGGQPQMGRRHDLARIASDVGAVPMQHLELVGEHFGAAAGQVPVLGPPGHGAEGSLFTGAADADGRMGPLHRLGVAAGAPQGEVAAVEVGGLVGQQPDDHLAGLVEAIEALLQRAQLDPVGVALLFVPAGADAQLQPAVGDDVDRRGHIGQHRRVAVDDPGHQHADPEPLGGLGQRGRHRPAFQTRAGRIREDRIEVIEGPRRLEHLDLVGRLPDGQHVGPLGVLRGCLDGEAHGRSVCPLTDRLRSFTKACDRPVFPGLVWVSRSTVHPLFAWPDRRIVPLMASSHPDLAAEQQYVDRAYACLTAMRRRTAAAAADAEQQAAADWNAAVALAHLEQRLDTLEMGGRVLCFGRLDDEQGDSWYIGRRHVEDEHSEPVVVDWRAPVSVPFYRATFSDPMGLHRRRRFTAEGRHLTDIFDEFLDEPDEDGLAGGGGVPDPLLHELERARTGAMRDIVGTIQAEQDVVIRAPLDRVVVVQGGPGTGKTAVGLHRAAYLLYEHRVELQRDGVLVIGPNPVFLRYIAEVLPSLGETAVAQTTIVGLGGRYRVRATDEPFAAAVKGDARMAAVVGRSCRSVVRPAAGDLRVRTRWGSTTIGAADLAVLLADAMDRAPTLGIGRDAFRLEVHRLLHRRIGGGRADFLVDRAQVEAELRSDKAFQRALDRMWPRTSAAATVRKMLSSRVFLATAAAGFLSGDEQKALLRKAGSSIDREPWTAADIPLLDEAEHLLNSTSRRYGHIVVDEAQDLSAMAVRMLARRTLAVPSMTILADLAQATAPAGQERWEAVLEHLGLAGQPDRAGIEELAIGYRVPAQILE